MRTTRVEYSNLAGYFRFWTVRETTPTPLSSCIVLRLTALTNPVVDKLPGFDIGNGDV